MADEVKFNWDANKHDERVPEKAITIEAACPHCGAKSKFARMHKAMVEVYQESKRLSLTMVPSPLVICSGCSNLSSIQGIVQDVGKKLSQQAAQDPGKTTH